jgi:hypothetical protein
MNWRVDPPLTGDRALMSTRRNGAWSFAFFSTELRHLVLHMQLPSFEVYDLEIVDRAMKQGFGEFRLESLVPPFKVGQVRLLRHDFLRVSIRQLPANKRILWQSVH